MVTPVFRSKLGLSGRRRGAASAPFSFSLLHFEAADVAHIGSIPRRRRLIALSVSYSFVLNIPKRRLREFAPPGPPPEM